MCTIVSTKKCRRSYENSLLMQCSFIDRLVLRSIMYDQPEQEAKASFSARIALGLDSRRILGLGQVLQIFAAAFGTADLFGQIQHTVWCR